MTTLESEQKDILEKLNEIAIEANWGTTERINGVPKAVAVIWEAWACIRDLRAENNVIEKQFYELVENTNNALKRQAKEILQTVFEKIKEISAKSDCMLDDESVYEDSSLVNVLNLIGKAYGVKVDENV